MTARMRRIAIVLSTVLSLAGLSCESGWDVEGRVMTANAPDKARPLYVYGVNAPTIDAATLRVATDGVPYLLLEQAPAIPADGLNFSDSGFGCHRGSFAALAWAPATAAQKSPTGMPLFMPQPGDYLTVSDVRHPYCGFYSRPEHIDLLLDAGDSP